MIIDPSYNDELKEFYEDHKDEMAQSGIVLSETDISDAAVRFQKYVEDYDMCREEARMSGIEDVCSYRFPENHPEEKEHFTDEEILDAVAETLTMRDRDYVHKVSSAVRKENQLCINMVNGQEAICSMDKNFAVICFSVNLLEVMSCDCFATKEAAIQFMKESAAKQCEMETKEGNDVDLRYHQESQVLKSVDGDYAWALTWSLIEL